MAVFHPQVQPPFERAFRAKRFMKESKTRFVIPPPTVVISLDLAAEVFRAGGIVMVEEESGDRFLIRGFDEDRYLTILGWRRDPKACFYKAETSRAALEFVHQPAAKKTMKRAAGKQ